MLQIPDLTPADAAFGRVDYIPKWDDIPKEFKATSNPFAHAVSKWFFHGAKRFGTSIVVDGITFTVKANLDCGRALTAIRGVMTSWDPSHEHKEAACAYMLSEWFDLKKSKDSKS